MLKRLKALENKICYINRVLIDINSKQTALQSQNAELAEELSRISSCVGMLDQQIKALGERQEKLEGRLLSSISILEEKWKRIDDYVNLEYFMLPSGGGTKYLLAGFYGAVNLGDELMLQKLYEDLSPVRNNIYVLMCDNADLDVFLYPGMNIIHYPKNKFDFNFLSNIFDCVIFGGGAVIDDTKYSLNDSYQYDLGKIFIELASSFISRGKKVYSVGLSTNDRLTDDGYIGKLQRIISGSAFFSVRDKYSAAVLEDTAGKQVSLINDIVLTYKSKIYPEETEGKYRIGIIWICYEELKKPLYELLDHILDKYDMSNTEVRFIPFYDYRKNDQVFYDELCREYGNEIFSVSDMPYDFCQAYSEICRCNLIISMRYHGALLGLKGGRRTLALLYSQHRHYYNKMRDLYEKFEKEQDLFTSIEELKKSVPVAPGLTNREIQFDNSAYDAVISELINLSDK